MRRLRFNKSGLMLKHIVIVNGYALLLIFALVSADTQIKEEWVVTIPLMKPWMGWLLFGAIIFDIGVALKNEIKKVRGWFNRRKQPAPVP